MLLQGSTQYYSNTNPLALSLTPQFLGLTEGAISCPASVCLLANGPVNEIKFLGLTPHKWHGSSENKVKATKMIAVYCFC